MEWAWRWKVRVRAHSSHYDPFGDGGEHIRYVDTVAELRALVMAGRSDPRVMSFKYEKESYLAGTPPEECPNGHTLGGPSATRATLTWRVCGCGGHTLYTCRTCGVKVADPSPGPDCGADRGRPR